MTGAAVMSTVCSRQRAHGGVRSMVCLTNCRNLRTRTEYWHVMSLVVRWDTLVNGRHRGRQRDDNRLLARQMHRPRRPHVVRFAPVPSATYRILTPRPPWAAGYSRWTWEAAQGTRLSLPLASSPARHGWASGRSCRVAFDGRDWYEGPQCDGIPPPRPRLSV